METYQRTFSQYPRVNAIAIPTRIATMLVPVNAALVVAERPAYTRDDREGQILDLLNEQSAQYLSPALDKSRP